MSASALSPLLPRIPEPHARGHLLPARLARIAVSVDLPWACQTLSSRLPDAALERTDDHVFFVLPDKPREIAGLQAEPRLTALLTREGVLCLTLSLVIDHDLDALEQCPPRITADHALAHLYDDRLRALTDALAPACSGRQQPRDLGWFCLVAARVRPGSDFLRAYRPQIRNICAGKGQDSLHLLEDGDAYIAIADSGAFVIARQSEPVEREILSSIARLRALRDEHTRLMQETRATDRTDCRSPRSTIREAVGLPKLEREVRRLRALADARRDRRRDRLARTRIELLLWTLLAISLILVARGWA